MAASKPTSSLSKINDTLYPLTLNRYFGTLTIVWVVPLSDSKLTPEPRLLTSMTLDPFGVGQETEEFLPLNPKSVALQDQWSQSRLDCGQLRQEPAITGLDWLFTPNPRSEERLHTATLQASTRFYSRFTLPRIRSTGFGSYSCDFRHFHTLPLIACGLIAFAKAPFL